MKAIPRSIARRRRAVTLLELMLAMTFMTIISLFVFTALLVVMRHSISSLTRVPAESENFKLLSRMRTELLSAQFNSWTFGTNGESITYRSGSRQTRSSIAYDPNTGITTFDPDLDSNGDERVWNRRVAVRFVDLNDPRRLQIRVEAPAKDSRQQDLTYSYTDVITVRN
ncbi:MAG: hypothetical protein RLY93_17995 [Sumerlaeia bacterium]